MTRVFSKFIFWLAGWKVVGSFPKEVTKAVMIAAPHTSNWDFLYVRCAFYILRVPLRYTIKKELMVLPFGFFLKKMGAIPIDRSPKEGLKRKNNMVSAMVKLFDTHDQLIVLVTPEGSRKYVKRWKTGFYRVAEQAHVPLVMGYLDYKNKEAGVGPVFYPTGNIDKDIDEIKEFYRTIVPKHPEKGVI